MASRIENGENPRRRRTVQKMTERLKKNGYTVRAAEKKALDLAKQYERGGMTKKDE